MHRTMSTLGSTNRPGAAGIIRTGLVRDPYVLDSHSVRWVSPQEISIREQP